MFKKILAVFLSILLSSLLCVSQVSAKPASQTSKLSLSAESAVLIEATSGSILYEKNAHSRMAMASTTKIMTALIAAESGNLDRVVSVSADAVGVEGSSVYLYAGERITLFDLLAAMLLESANDAAAAIAIELGGTIDGFCNMMNARATELGLVDTRFKNPHGLFDEEHYTTAYELALVAREAMKNDVIRKIVATKKMTVTPVEGSSRLLYNHNKLLSRYDGTTGIKTGFTKKSGRCLIGSAERDGLELITVTLNAPDDWNDHEKLFDYGFENFISLKLAEAGEVCYMQSVIGGTSQTVALAYEEDIVVTVKKSDQDKIKSVIETFNRYEFAPVLSRKMAGNVLFSIDGELIAKTRLVTLHSVKEKKKESFFSNIINLFK